MSRSISVAGNFRRCGALGRNVTLAGLLSVLTALPVSAQSATVNSVPDGISYATAAINPAIATWKALHAPDKLCALTKLGISELIGNGVALTVKHFVHSPRPCAGCAPDGMPSGHSMNGAIGAFSSGGWGLAFSVPTPFLRVAAHRHTKTQVLAGTLLGLGADAVGHYLVKCEP